MSAISNERELRANAMMKEYRHFEMLMREVRMLPNTPALRGGSAEYDECDSLSLS